MLSTWPPSLFTSRPLTLQLTIDQANSIFNLASECQVLGIKLAKEFHVLSGLEAMHRNSIKGTMHETLTLRHSAQEAAYSAICWDDITEAEHEAMTHCLHSEADAAWKEMHKVMYNHQLDYDQRLSAFPKEMETTLNNMRDQVWVALHALAENEGITFNDCLSLALQVLNLLPQIPMDISFQTQIPLTIAYCPESSIYRRWCPKQGGVSPLHKEVRASRTLSKVLGGATHQPSEGVDLPPSPAASNNSVRSGRPWGSGDQSCSHAQSIASSRSLQSGSVISQVTEGGQESSSESKISHEEEDAPCKEENTEAGKGEVEVLSDGQVASDGKERQGCPQIQDTLTDISQVFSTHEDTDSDSNPREKIQSIWWKLCQPSPKEGMPPRDLSGSSSEEEQPTDEVLCDKAQQRACQLDTNFDAWWYKKIAKGIIGWATRDTMICDLPEHGKAQPSHPDPVGPPLDYMGEHQVFDGIQSDIYNQCQFYILGMTGDPPEFPTPREPATHGQIRDLLKSARAIGQPYMILAHSADSVTAVSMLRELHTAACLRCFQVNFQGKSVKLSFCPFCTYMGGNDLSYLNHIIIVNYNASYRCRKCLKQAFVSSSALHNHKKVCLGLIPRKSTRGSDGKPSSGRGGNSSHGGSSKATPKKDGKAPATDYLGSSAPPASQTSPCCSGRETSHHKKSHKNSKDSGEKKKKKKDASPAGKNSSHKARKDGGCH